MFVNPDKVCAETGSEIIDTLISEQLMLPVTENAQGISREEKIEKITGLFAEIIDTLGYDRTDEELVDTPKRIAKMWVDDFFNAWDPQQFPKCTSFDNKGSKGFVDEMIIVKDMNVVTNCAHHFVIVDVNVDVAYIPAKRMIGISKINKVVKRLARNPTSQETLGKCIARAISLITESPDVAVRIGGTHYCVKGRSADDQTSETVTFAALGKFAEPNSAIRHEFNQAIKR